jgi:hypothetical protein
MRGIESNRIQEVGEEEGAADLKGLYHRKGVVFSSEERRGAILVMIVTLAFKGS